MKYPFWLPKPRRHWLRVIELLLLSIPVGLVFYVVLRLGAVISIPMLLNDQAFNVWGIIYLIALILIPPYILAHFHEFLHDEHRSDYPQWLPRPRCWQRGIVNWLVSILALMICIILLPADLFQKMQEQEAEALLIITWMIVAAYLFYLGDGIGWFFGELFKLPSALIGRKQKPKPSERKE